MKRILCVVFSLMFIMNFLGCAKEPPKESEKTKDKIQVVTTIFPCYDFARVIAGDKAEVTMLLPFGSESHTYEPTLEDISLIGSCDVFIYVGGEIDPWAETALNTSFNKNRRVISLLDIFDIAHESEGNHENHSHSEEIDQHIWTSPQNAMEIVKVIAENLCDADPKNTQSYTTRRGEYLEKLTLLDKEIQESVNDSENKTLVFADRFPFAHFCNAYGLSHQSALEGCTSDTEPTITAVKSLIDSVNKKNIPAVLYTETADGSIADTVTNATGCEKRIFYSCHSISEAQFEDGESYLSLMEKNLEVLREVLS